MVPEERDSPGCGPRAHVQRRQEDEDLRVSATPPSRWTITPLFYSRSTDLPVLRGRRCVRGAPERPQTGELEINLRFRRF